MDALTQRLNKGKKDETLNPGSATQSCMFPSLFDSL